MKATNKNKKIFVTSALPYVNNQPHLGNIIGSLLSADVYARFLRKEGYDVKFICGTDEYGTATEMAALKQGITPEEIVEKNRKIHKKIYDWFKIKCDYFGQTHCKEHVELVQEIFLKTIDYFEEENVNMFYCEKCKQFLADRYVEGICKCGATANGDQCDDCGQTFETDSLKDVKCKLCQNEPVKKNQAHLFLRLDLLKKYVEKLSTEGWSSNAVDIFKNWLKMDVKPRCFTRKLKYNWGVPIPLKKYEDLVFYVWFDAPIGYLTFLKQNIKEYKEWLKGADWVQFMGKDNVPFHSITFPSILYALKENELKRLKTDENREIVEKIERIQIKEKVSDADELIGKIKSAGYDDYEITDEVKLDYNIKISATDYLTYNKRKFSKSKHIGVFGLDLIDGNLGDVDKWRFYLIKRRPEGKDTDFSTEEFIRLVNSELINNIGNFINRTCKFVEKKEVDVYETQKSFVDGFESQIGQFRNSIEILFGELKEEMERVNLRNGLNKLLEISSTGNKFLQNLQTNKVNMKCGFAVAFDLVILICEIVEIFCPESRKKFDCFLEIPETFSNSFADIVENKKKRLIGAVSPVFNIFTPEIIKNIEDFK